MTFDPERVQYNAQNATDEYLMDRIAFWRDDLEPAAVEIIAAELRRRGIQPDAIEAHRQAREATGVCRLDGTVCKCSFCDRPACERRWGWHWLRGWFPVLPCRYAYCEVHRGERQE